MRAEEGGKRSVASPRRAAGRRLPRPPARALPSGPSAHLLLSPFLVPPLYGVSSRTPLLSTLAGARFSCAGAGQARTSGPAPAAADGRAAACRAAGGRR